MKIDIFGKKRYKINLHMHTSLSDGKQTPKEAIEMYRQHGYDAVAITDHWLYGKGYTEEDGMLILSGVEYNILGVSSRDGLFHIVGVGMKEDPRLPTAASAQDALDAIKAAGGLAIIAHPAWSLNTPEHILALKGADAVEIYNTVSGLHMSRRPDSSLIVDMLGAQGKLYPLIADDDTHYYDDDACRSFIMVEADSPTPDALISSIREGRFYASQGPEVHIFKEGAEIVAESSPCREIVFHSDAVWSKRVFTGDGITKAIYKPQPHETFIRAEVVDSEDRHAWTNPIMINSEEDGYEKAH